MDGSELVAVMDLGNPCVSDFVPHPGDGTRFPLRVGVGATSGLLQLFDSYPPAKMYRKYWYLSGINETMLAGLRELVESTRRWVQPLPGDVVLDIGCNDGTLLSFWAPDLVRVGIDPAENLVDLARRHADVVANDFFSAETFRALAPGRKAAVITSIAMFYDIDDPHGFVEDVRACLASNGVWVLEMAYAPLMLSENAFDCICHEHLCYYTLRVLDSLLAAHGLRVIDVLVNNVNGGSFRLYVAHEGQRMSAPLFDEDIGRYRRSAFLELEARQGLDGPEAYAKFVGRVEEQKNRAITFLRGAREAGKTVVGYGASTKGNTLLQYYGVTPDLLPSIADRSPAKHGTYTAGSGIPIISEEEMRVRRPDYLLVLPWHFLRAFQARERELLALGTHFVVPLPEFQVVEN